MFLGLCPEASEFQVRAISEEDGPGLALGNARKKPGLDRTSATSAMPFLPLRGVT